MLAATQQQFRKSGERYRDLSGPLEFLIIKLFSDESIVLFMAG
jgi:hypothetical protein